MTHFRRLLCPLQWSDSTTTWVTFAPVSSCSQNRVFKNFPHDIGHYSKFHILLLQHQICQCYLQKEKFCANTILILERPLNCSKQLQEWNALGIPTNEYLLKYFVDKQLNIYSAFTIHKLSPWISYWPCFFCNVYPQKSPFHCYFIV